MKKSISLLIVALMAIILIKPFSAKADVIWEPYGDKFYEKHRAGMLLENCGYIVNSPDGYVYIYESPDKTKSSQAYKLNGEQVPCAYSYEYEGHRWGLVSYESPAWMILDDCYRVYDSTLFVHDHENELEEISMQVELKSSYYYFSYPGSGEGSPLFDCPDAYAREKYVDADGNEWLHFGYTYGLRDFWVNITNPESSTCKKLEIKHDFEIYAPKEPSAASENNREQDNEEEPATNNGVLVGVGTVLAVAVIGAATAIVLKIKKKK